MNKFGNFREKEGGWEFSFKFDCLLNLGPFFFSWLYMHLRENISRMQPALIKILEKKIVFLIPFSLKCQVQPGENDPGRDFAILFSGVEEEEEKEKRDGKRMF